MREHHSLGRARRSRGVDQRRDVPGLDRPPGRLEVEVRGLVLPAPLQLLEPGAGLVDDDDLRHGRNLLDRPPHLVEERSLGDDDAVGGVLEQVGDLIDRRGGVDRERRRPEVEGGRVDEMKLRPVDGHHRDGVAGTDAERAQAAGDSLDPGRVLRPGDLRARLGRTQRDLPRELRCRSLEDLGEACGVLGAHRRFNLSRSIARLPGSNANRVSRTRPCRRGIACAHGTTNGASSGRFGSRPSPDDRPRSRRIIHGVRCLPIQTASEA